MSRREFAALLVLAAIGLWTLVTLGFRALWADVACGGPACDRMREEAAAGRDLLLVAWAFGIVVAAALLIALWRRRRSA